MWLPWFASALLISLIADLGTKALFLYPEPGRASEISGGGWIKPAQNTGVAWGMFHEHPEYVTILTAILIPVMLWWWWVTFRKEGRAVNLAFGCIIGGALGNGWDRLSAQLLGWRAGVRDFIYVDLGFWPLDPFPTFNIADVAINIGFFLLLIIVFFFPPPESATTAAAEPTADDASPDSTGSLTEPAQPSEGDYDAR